MTLNERIETIRTRYDGCFGCGPANPIGLQLDGFRREGQVVRVAFTPSRDHSGFTDVVHGGIIAAALDEVMAWTAMLTQETLVVTGSLDLRYRKPVTPDRTYDLVGSIEERRGRRMRIGASLRDGDGVLAEATGSFFAVGAIPDLE